MKKPLARLVLCVFFGLTALLFVMMPANNALGEEPAGHICKKSGEHKDGPGHEGDCQSKYSGMDPELAKKISEGLNRAHTELALGNSKTADNEMVQIFMDYKKAGVEPPKEVLLFEKIVHRTLVYEALVHYFDYFDKLPLLSENMLNIAERYFEYLKDDGGVVPVDFLEQRTKLSRVLVVLYEATVKKAIDAKDYNLADMSLGYLVTECRKLKELDPSFEVPTAKIEELRVSLEKLAGVLEEKMFEEQADVMFNSLDYEGKKALFEFMKKRDPSSFTEYDKKLFDKLNRYFGV